MGCRAVMSENKTGQGGIPSDYTMQFLCRSMLKRNRDSISTQKPDFALRKLEAIVGAALRISNQKGFAAMSLRELAQESGVSMGGMYSYFDSKTDLLKMILGEVAAAASTVLRRPPDTLRDDPQAHLMWFVEQHIALTNVMTPWFVFSFMEAKTFPADQRRMATQSEEITEGFLVDILKSGMESGVFRCTDPLLTAALIKPLLQDWYVKRSKYRRRKVSMKTYVAEVKRIVLAACGEPPEPAEVFAETRASI